MKTLFKDILNAIATLEDGSGDPLIRYVDWDMGQIDVDPEFMPVSWPCALINVSDRDVSNIGENAQMREVLISIRMAFKVFERATNLVSGGLLDAALEHMDKMDEVYKVLSGMEGDSYQKLVCEGTIIEPRPHPRIYTMTFSTILSDERDMKEWLIIPAPSVDVELPVIYKRE